MYCTVFECLRLNQIISEAMSKKGQATHLSMPVCVVSQQCESQEIKMKLHWPGLMLASSLANGQMECIDLYRENHKQSVGRDLYDSLV